MSKGIRWFPHQPRCECVADATVASSARTVRRGQPPRRKRALIVWHHRRADDAWFWHWSDQQVQP